MESGDDGMSGSEALQSAQFVTAKRKRLAVVSAVDWEALTEWLERVEDTPKYDYRDLEKLFADIG